MTSRTSSTDTLAKQTLAPKENEKEARFKEFWRKKPRQKNCVQKIGAGVYFILLNIHILLWTMRAQ